MNLVGLKEEFHQVYQLMIERISDKITFSECIEIISHCIDNIPEVIDNENFIYEFGSYYDSKEEIFEILKELLNHTEIVNILSECEEFDFNATIGDIVVNNYGLVLNNFGSILKLSSGNYYYYLR